MESPNSLIKIKALQIIICSLFLISSNLKASQTLFQPEVKFPAGFTHLIASIQEYQLLPEERKILNQTIFTIDYLLKHIDLQELNSIIASEIYKNLLEENQSFHLKKGTIYQLSMLDRIEKYLKLHNNRLDPFSRWLIRMIKAGMTNIFKDQKFKAYLTAQKSKELLREIQNSKMIRKLDRLFMIYDQFINSTPEEFHQTLKPSCIQLLKTINEYSLYYARFSTFKEISTEKIAMNTQKITSFSIRKVDPLTTKERSLEEILDSIHQTAGKMPKRKKGQWSPQDTPETQITDLFPQKDPDYIPPGKLPRPVTDWKVELSRLDNYLKLFPAKDPDYVPPKNLPKPAGKW